MPALVIRSRVFPTSAIIIGPSRKHPTWVGIHAFTALRGSQDVGGRSKSGHDVERDVVRFEREPL
jgi:hypothetical protein